MWPGWAGVQGIASVIGVLSIVTVVLGYRRNLREADFPGVGFDIARLDSESEGPSMDDERADDTRPIRETVVVTMSALRGAVLYDVLVRVWAPAPLVAHDDDGRVEFRPRFQFEDGPISVKLSSLLDDAGAAGATVKVGLTGYQRTALGPRFVGVRLDLDPDGDREEWAWWRWWQWRWWPRQQAGRWRRVRLPSARQIRRSPYSDPKYSGD